MTTHAEHLHPSRDAASLTRKAICATLHCLTGCAIGEVLGLALATALGWGDAASVAAAVGLAFVFGYGLTMISLLPPGLTVRRALPLAFASDTFSLATMEVVDNVIVPAIPGTMAAGLGDPLFWARSPSRCSSRSGPRSR